MPIVYRIICLTNNKVYVGSTSNKRQKRWIVHRSELRRNKHYCKKLQNAWNKYGELYFYCENIEEVAIDNYRKQEQFWIDYYSSIDPDILFNSEKEVLPGTKTYSYLSEKQVIEIIEKCEIGIKRTGLADYYGVSKQTISDIAMGRSWSYLPRKKIRWNPSRKIPDEGIKRIKRYSKLGLTQKEIAEIYGVNQSTINRIISGLRRKEIRYAV